MARPANARKSVPSVTSPEGIASNGSRRQPLSRDKIIATAIAIVDAEGLPALTMRRLAGDLGVVATAIYWHIRTRDEVLQGMLESVVDEIESSHAGSSWVEEVRLVCWSTRRMLMSHPWVPQIWRLFPGVTAPRFTKSLSRIGKAAGFDYSSTAGMSQVFWYYVIGSTYPQLMSEGTPSEFKEATIARWLEQGEEDLLELAPAMVRLDDDAVFERGLAYLLEGFARELE